MSYNLKYLSVFNLKTGIRYQKKIANREMLQIKTFVPTFEENGIFMRSVFFIQSTFADRNNNFQPKFIKNPFENIDFLSSNKKR